MFAVHRHNWRCSQCVTGVRIRKSRRAAARKRKRYNDDFVEEWEEGYHDKPRAKRARIEDEVVDDPYGNKIRNDTSKSRAARYANRCTHVLKFSFKKQRSCHAND